MGRIIAIANQKGGVGKTTTAINLSACLAEAGQKVLTIDVDPQGNTTSGLGIDKNSVENTIYELILEEVDIKEAIIDTEEFGRDHHQTCGGGTIPSSIRLRRTSMQSSETESAAEANFRVTSSIEYLPSFSSFMKYFS